MCQTRIASTKAIGAWLCSDGRYSTGSALSVATGSRRVNHGPRKPGRGTISPVSGASVAICSSQHGDSANATMVRNRLRAGRGRGDRGHPQVGMTSRDRTAPPHENPPSAMSPISLSSEGSLRNAVELHRQQVSHRPRQTARENARGLRMIRTCLASAAVHDLPGPGRAAGALTGRATGPKAGLRDPGPGIFDDRGGP